MSPMVLPTISEETCAARKNGSKVERTIPKDLCRFAFLCLAFSSLLAIIVFANFDAIVIIGILMYGVLPLVLLMFYVVCCIMCKGCYRLFQECFDSVKETDNGMNKMDEESQFQDIFY